MKRTNALTRIWRANEFSGLVLTTVVLVVLLVGSASLFIDSFLAVRPGDAPKYLQFARAPLSSAAAPSAPFKFRALTPFLVWLLPTSRVVGFAIVNLSALVATGVAFYWYLRELGFAVRKSVGGLVLFVVSPAIAYAITNVVLVDALGYLFLVCALWAAARDDWFLFAIVLAVGVTARQTVLFALPVYLLYRLQIAGFRGAVRAVAAALPASAVLLGLRLFYGFSNDTIAAIVARGVEAQLHKLELSIFYIPYEIYSAFGTLWLLALLYGYRHVVAAPHSDSRERRFNDGFLVAGLLVAPFAFLQPLVARDIARVLFILFPVVIPTALAVIETLARHTAYSLIALAGVAAIAGVIGAVLVLPALAGNVASVSLPVLQFLALVGAVNELVVIGIALDLKLTEKVSEIRRG